MHDDHTPQIQKSPLIADNTVLTITIPWKEAQEAYQKALRTRGKNVKTAGFRKGKVPASVVEQTVGRQELILTAINSVLPTKYPALIEKSGKKPISQPEFLPQSLEWEKDWQIEAHFAEEPIIKLGNYKKVITTALKDATKEITKEEKELEKSAKNKKAENVTPTELTESQKQDTKLRLVIKALVTEIKPAIQEILVKQQAHQEYHRLEHQLGQINMSMDDYLEKRSISKEALLQDLAATGLAQLQTDFILLAITREEKITVTETEVTDQLGNKVQNATDEIKNMIKQRLQRQKLVSFLTQTK